MKTPEQMKAEMDELERQAPTLSLWRHNKSGTQYQILGHCFLEATADPAILYASTKHGAQPVWARSAAEFLDGRFERESWND